MRLVLRLPLALRKAIVAQCVAALPNEGCGLLLGSREGRFASVVEARPERNILAASDRYEIEAEAVFAAHRAARAAGRQLLGAWHSHPASRAVPSATDLAQAWPDWCYLIVGLSRPGRPELRAWRLLGEDFVADQLEIE